ncbi:MAG TPA: cell division protein FtsQ/DivIB [Dokdonella sp.]
MNGGSVIRLFAWAIAIALVALPIVGVLNGWFASERWPVTRLAVRAEFDHVSAEQIRAAAGPRLGKGFFAMQLDEVRDAVARLPWVERVEARKRWPDTVELVVYEQQPYAHWSEGRLVNRAGRLFSVPGGDSLQGLPRLAGPDDRLGDVLRFHADCLRELGGSGLVLDAVQLSQRGSWRLHLGAGTVVELGRADAMDRLKRFLDVWPRIASTRASPPQSVDLRYANGFAVRWDPVQPDSSAGDGESGMGNGRSVIPPDAGVHGWHPPAGELLAQADTGSSHSGFPIPDSRLLAHSLFPISYSRLP